MDANGTSCVYPFGLLFGRRAPSSVKCLAPLLIPFVFFALFRPFFWVPFFARAIATPSVFCPLISLSDFVHVD